MQFKINIINISILWSFKKINMDCDILFVPVWVNNVRVPVHAVCVKCRIIKITVVASTARMEMHVLIKYLMYHDVYST